MSIKKVKTEDAPGLKLLHDITAMHDGFKGPLFKRGHVIRKEDIPALLDIGKKTVFTGDLEPGMVHEEDCARALAEMTATAGVHFEGPSEGKMLMIADKKGFFRVDRELLRNLNSIEDITITTLPDHSRAEPGMRLASMRIVPLFTRKERIGEAERLCADKPLFKLIPYKALNAGLIITGSEVYEGRIKDRFEPVVRKKLSYFPGRVTGVKICDDDETMIKKAAKDLIDNGAELLIFTGGMSVDPDDLTPTAIRGLGADIISSGLPAQPGNMTLVAYLGEIPIIGLPGAAISLPTTVFDVLLPQICSGERFTKEELISLGEGGLCRLCETCHFPNCTFGRY